ncbi:MAG TPA: pseudouridine synthase [Puia sp.]|nr:pseudouridine synthase [Puia sp.]
MHRYYIVYKPFQVLSQFSSQEGKATLKDFFPVPPDVYPVGRLDFDSEGLLILTNDRQFNHRLLDPAFAHHREYWVQVEGAITPAALRQLETGVTITVDGKPHTTRPAKALLISPDPRVPVRHPPIRYRANIPTSWISLTLTEGKNRQVRKMTAQTGFPTLRLIRYRILEITIDGMQPGEMREIRKEDITFPK